ncbi:MAG: alpha-glucan family phosphorylase [Elusimicrobia bacterium]|nr:alpha-glucan family phosphorylase [Elusimicrobiota bacterium]
MRHNPKIALPARIARLEELAYNLWWSWNPSARSLFKVLDRTLWQTTHHNPVKVLVQCRPERFEACAKDPAFLQWFDSVVAQFDEYMRDPHLWFKGKHSEGRRPVAYFSAEFGVHNSLPIYSGGLGILAGDHCKTASDLGIPLVGVGFMYPQGYVQQRIGVEGWQQNIYEMLDWSSSPVRPALTPDGSPCVLRLNLGSWPLHVAVWQIDVGRVPLYLMDTHVEGNDPGDREISGRLYGGDRTMRLRQEIVLGIGGIRILRALGVDPEVYHANEGHAAFMLLERLRECVEKGMDFRQAREEVARTSVFTTHTPVPAGHDVFPEETVAEYFKGYWTSLGIDREAFLALGRHGDKPGWNMSALALRLSGRANGVSRRNGIVARDMWKDLWPGKPVDEVPITHVTNGVHLPTWLSQRMAELYSTHLSADWRRRQDDPALWAKVDDIPDEVLWGAHVRCKRDLLNFIRSQTRHRWQLDRVDATQVLASGALLDPEALTIGFARRFARYKRATLILHDIERLKKLLLDPWRPLQLVFAGKSHPADDGGKQLIQQVYRLAKDPAIGGRIAFVEDYDMHKARYLVQGVDLWLNNPLFPLEACGTSGQKAAANGVPNLSILDGWWEEGWTRENGWAPKSSAGLPDAERDAADAAALYDVLEEQIIPLYFDQNQKGVPPGWVRVMKESIKSVAPQFCSNRMLKDYSEKLYFPAHEPALAK